MEARLLSIKGDSAINPQLPCPQCQTTSISFTIYYLFPTASFSWRINSLRKTLPTVVLGNSSRNST